MKTLFAALALVALAAPGVAAAGEGEDSRSRAVAISPYEDAAAVRARVEAAARTVCRDPSDRTLADFAERNDCIDAAVAQALSDANRGVTRSAGAALGSGG